MEKDRPPDGGWGWIVALSAFLSCTIVDGVKYSFGIIFIELLNTFKGSKGETSLIMSLQIGALLLAGPLNGALVNRFGCRKVCAVGTLIACIGFVSSAFATSIMWLYITFGLIGGIGFCLLNIPPFVMITRYFDKHLALAMGIGAMGSGVGTLVFNPVSKILIDEYTWRGTILIEGGFILNGLACALVLRKPSQGHSKQDKINRHKHLHSKDNINHKDLDGHCHDKLIDTNIKEKTDTIDSFEDKIDMDIEDSSYAILQHESVLDMARGIEIVDSDHHIDTSNCQLSKEEKGKTQKEKKDGKRWLSLKPLRDPGFILFMVSNILAELALNTPFAFLPDMMVYKGYVKEQAVWVMFCIGLVSTLSRIVIGFIADLPCISRVYLCNLLLMANGLFLVLSPFCFNYASYLAFGILFGFTAGSSNVLRGVLIPELFGANMMADLLGISMFFSSIAAFTGLPKAGALFDATGSYTPPFVMAGVELIVSGILIFLVPKAINRWSKQSN